MWKRGGKVEWLKGSGSFLWDRGRSGVERGEDEAPGGEEQEETQVKE